jgi:hypothetical protein
MEEFSLGTRKDFNRWRKMYLQRDTILLKLFSFCYSSNKTTIITTKTVVFYYAGKLFTTRNKLES